MKYLFKVILLFLIIFNFIVPVVYYSCTVAVFLAGLYYLFVKRSIPLTYFSSRYCFVILACTFLMAVINVSITVLYGHFFIGMFKRFIVQGWMLCCLVFSLPILIEEKTKAFEDAIVVICGAFALQGLIHTTGFVVTPVGDFLFSLQGKFTKGIEDTIGTPSGIERFRFYSLTGSPFFELPAAYGLACFMFFRLQLISGQDYLRGWKAFVIMCLMVMGIILSGRTGFIGFSLGVAFYVLYNWNHFSQIWRNTAKVAGGFIAIIVLFSMLLSPKKRNELVDKVFPFAFEAYYNWKETGEFSTSSSDALMEVHYYPIDTETLLRGRGGGSDDGVGYRHTDAGYMNDIIYGGIFYVLLLALYQFLYFRQPLRFSKMQNSRDGNIDFWCFLLLFAYMFLLEYKANSLGTQHITEVLLLYLGITYLTKQYALEDEEDESYVTSSISLEGKLEPSVE